MCVPGKERGMAIMKNTASIRECGRVMADQLPSANAHYFSPDPPQPTESVLPIMVDLDKVVEKQ